MLPRDEVIERWLREVSSDEDESLNEDCSDIEPDADPPNVLEESCESDSTIEADEQHDSTQVTTSTNIPLDVSPVVAVSASPHEQENSSDDDDVPLAQRRSRPRKKNYFGKNRFRWSSEPPVQRSRTVQHNIVQERQGLKPAYQNKINDTSTPMEIWQNFFTDEMLEKIVLHTNIKIWQIRPKYKKQTCVQDLTLRELKAFIGLLFYTAIFKENRAHYASWYNMDGTGREIYRCIMSKNRLEVLLKTIRFDNSETRAVRRENDISAPISELFDSFIQQCQNVYSIGTSACVDEMLLAFRGRCRFKMFMPKKPAKYGIKIMCLTDAKSGYLLNAYIYLGKDSDGFTLQSEYQRLKKPTQSVIRLISPIEGSNRNVTTDNWFTSIELMDLLKQKQLTLVGTLRKNQREIPPQFMPSRQRPVDSCIFGFTKDVTISSYVPKPNKAVVTISSMHHTAKVDENSKKPEIILYYNQTKFGVDVLDQRCSNYSTGRRTCRWPLAVFYRLLDISASNSYVVRLFTVTTKPESRLKFMKQLAEQLVRPHLEHRVTIVTIQRDLKNALNRILFHNNNDHLPTLQNANGVEERLEVRKTCSTCDPKKKRRTQYMCFECKKPICLECANKLCIRCREKQ